MTIKFNKFFIDKKYIYDNLIENKKLYSKEEKLRIKNLSPETFTSKEVVVIVRGEASNLFERRTTVKSVKLVTDHSQQKYIKGQIDGHNHSFGEGTEIDFM